LGLYIVGGRTEYFLTVRDGDPRIGGGVGFAGSGDGAPFAQAVADLNNLTNCDLYEEWGENAFLYWPAGYGGYGDGRFATAQDNEGAWYQLVAAGKTDIAGYGQPIWYRAFFLFTTDSNRPNALQIVGGKQLFWWDQTQQVVSEYAWGAVTSSWVGIGVSGDRSILKPATEAGQLFFDEHISNEGNFVTISPDGFGDFESVQLPQDELPAKSVTEGGDVPIDPPQLIAIAKHDPWGWGLSQIHLYVLPANAPNPNRQGCPPLALVGWKLRVRDMDEQHDWVVTNDWGRSSTEASQTMGIGQWWTDQWNWGPSILTLYFAPVTELQWRGWSEVPGGGRTILSDVGDAAVAYNSELYLFGVNSRDFGIAIADHGHYVNTFDGWEWSGWSEIPGGKTTYLPDAPVVYNDKLYLFVVDMNDHGHYLNVLDGVNWSGWAKVPGGETTSTPDVAVAFGGKLFVFAIDGNWTQRMNVFDGANWSGWSDVPGGKPPTVYQAATVYNHKLYLFAYRTITDPNNNPQLAVFDGVNWAGWVPVGSGPTLWDYYSSSPLAITLTSLVDAVGYDAKLYLFGIALDQQKSLYHANVFDGSKWSGWNALPDAPLVQSMGGGAVVAFNGVLYRFGIGSIDHQHYVNVLSPFALPHLEVKPVTKSGCDVALVEVEGTSETFVVDTAAMPNQVGLVYEWAVDGVDAGTTSLPKLTVDNLPPAGTHVTISVSVRSPDGCQASGRLVFATRSEPLALLLVALCKFVERIKHEAFLPPPYAPGDPALRPTEMPTVQALTRISNDAKNVERLTDRVIAVVQEREPSRAASRKPSR